MRDYTNQPVKAIYVIQSIYFTADLALAFYDNPKPSGMVAIIYIMLMLCVWYSSVVDQFVERKWPFQLFILAIYGIGLYASVQLWQTKAIGTILYLPLLISIGISEIIILIQMCKET